FERLPQIGFVRFRNTRRSADFLRDAVLDLKENALAEVARADSGRIEALNQLEHPLGLGDRVRLTLGRRFAPLSALLPQELVERMNDLLERALEVALVVDVPDDFLAQQQFPRREAEQGELIVEVVRQIPRRYRNRFEVLALLVLFPASARFEAVQQDLFPVDLVFCLL